MNKGYKTAVIGALGTVGSVMLKILEERDFPISECVPLDVPEKAGAAVCFKGCELIVQSAEDYDFRGTDFVFMAAGASAGEALAPKAAKAGAVVIDNSSFWRMHPEVPLVVPEVNPEALKRHKGIIANPNCSTIQMLVALKPVHEAFTLRRVVVSTYQSAAGAGEAGRRAVREECRDFCEGREIVPRLYTQPLLFNPIPRIDVFDELGYTKEEWKMIRETAKILEDPSIRVSATAVRVDSLCSHSESVYIETGRAMTAEDIRRVMAGQKGLTLMDDQSSELYPTARFAEGRDEVFVGRIRRDPFDDKAAVFWVVADNLRKGAALNAVQIGECLLSLRS